MKRIKFLLLIVLIQILTINVKAQDTSAINGTVTLKQCVDLAIKNNINVNRADLQMQSDKVNWQQARGNMLPFVSASIDHGFSQGRVIDPFTNGYINQNLTYANYGLNANINLWNGGSIRNNIKANSLNYEAGTMDWQQAKDNITITVILAYLQVLNNGEQLTAAQQQAEVTRKQVERLDVMNKAGALQYISDYYNTKGQLASDELTVVNTKNSLETSRLDLCQLMNIPYTPYMQLEKADSSLIPVLYDGTPGGIYNTAMQQLALVKAVDLRKESATKALRSAKGQLWPSLVLGGALGTNYSNAATTETPISTMDVETDSYVKQVNGDKLHVYSPQTSYSSGKISYGDQWKNNFNSAITLGIQIPILNGLQARSRVNQAKITEKRADIEAQTTKIQLQQNVEQAYMNMTAAFSRYQKLDSQVQDFAESFRAAEIRFNAGAMTSVDYLLVKNNYDRSYTNLIAAKYDYLLRTKILDFYQGKLTF